MTQVRRIASWLAGITAAFSTAAAVAQPSFETAQTYGSESTPGGVEARPERDLAPSRSLKRVPDLESPAAPAPTVSAPAPVPPAPPDAIKDPAEPPPTDDQSSTGNALGTAAP